jgi:hypothetical protein
VTRTFAVTVPDEHAWMFEPGSDLAKGTMVYCCREFPVAVAGVVREVTTPEGAPE